MNHSAVVKFLPGDHTRFKVLTRIDSIANAFRTVETWKLRHKTRRQLAVTEARILKDVGITEAQRSIEVNKPFWEI
jgi:uncharacterized protein YjiS (DUF1127 family)